MNDHLSFLERYKGRRILVAPLNWGLGHATRCIPIIQYLERYNEVFVASDGLALEWLADYFPQGKYFALPSYNPTYSSKYMWINAALQAPKIVQAISRERKVVEEIVNQNKIDLIISDHRLGALAEGITNIIMAHQIDILHPSKLLATIASKIQARYINQFDELWIPDRSGVESLSGQLSAATHISIPHKRIGTLSRFKDDRTSTSKTFDLIAILSGPEPARTIFEQRIIKVVSQITHLRTMIVRGTTVEDNQSKGTFPSHLSFINVSYGNDLKSLIQQSHVVLCRSGYSSLMDLERLDRGAILIPTPGQPEQEYLGVFNSKKDGFLMIEESKMDESTILHAIDQLSFSK